MNWNRIMHIAGMVVGGALAVGPVAASVLPRWAIPIGAVLLALSRLDKATGLTSK